MVSLYQFLVIAIVVGVALYLLKIVEMDPTLKLVVRVIVLAGFIIWALRWLLVGPGAKLIL